MTNEVKSTRGGKREGSGRKDIFPELLSLEEYKESLKKK